MRTTQLHGTSQQYSCTFSCNLKFIVLDYPIVLVKNTILWTTGEPTSWRSQGHLFPKSAWSGEAVQWIFCQVSVAVSVVKLFLEHQTNEDSICSFRRLRLGLGLQGALEKDQEAGGQRRDRLLPAYFLFLILFLASVIVTPAMLPHSGSKNIFSGSHRYFSVFLMCPQTRIIEPL